MSELISVCLPTYNLGENSITYLKENLDSINCQTYENIEISISDNSTDDIVKDFVKDYPFKKNIKVIYEKTDRGRGHSGVPNTNNAWDNSTGDYIKSLPQDDKLQSEDALELIVNCLRDNEWCAFKSVFQRGLSPDYFFTNGNFPQHSPTYPEALLQGLNYIGGPGSCAWRNCDIRLDESMRWLNDCDLYYRFWKMWGPMAIIDSNHPLVCIRDRQDALSNVIPDAEKALEVSTLINKHKNA